jgi:hypothetical protein
MDWSSKMDLRIIRLERKTPLLAVDVDADIQFVQLRYAKE